MITGAENFKPEKVARRKLVKGGQRKPKKPVSRKSLEKPNANGDIELQYSCEKCDFVTSGVALFKFHLQETHKIEISLGDAQKFTQVTEKIFI